MKEKLSCSLDGNLVEIMDQIISQRPQVRTRSAFIEMSLILAIRALIIDLDHEDLSAGFNDDLLRKLYEVRCAIDAQKESKN